MLNKVRYVIAEIEASNGGRTLTLHPNGMPITRAAQIDREDVLADPTLKNAPILSTRSGVGCMGGLLE
jgi:hypothetical protein